ncbi:MAG TPA: hypothetical protein VHW00_14600 [Thermoanaerobaculia bacterium]|nr:hypothetical protein [Thermoanaerobaculia bacterium]
MRVTKFVQYANFASLLGACCHMLATHEDFRVDPDARIARRTPASRFRPICSRDGSPTTTPFFTKVSIRQLKEIDAATHPAARLERSTLIRVDPDDEQSPSFL